MILQIGNADNRNNYLLKDKREFRVVLCPGHVVLCLIFFSSPELKAQVSYSDRPLSVVCPSVRLSVRLSVRPSVRPSVCPSVRLSVNFYIFDFFSRTAGPILTKLGTNHPWGEGILNC